MVTRMTQYIFDVTDVSNMMLENHEAHIKTDGHPEQESN